jgi:hypothetical protein
MDNDGWMDMRIPGLGRCFCVFYIIFFELHLLIACSLARLVDYGLVVAGARRWEKFFLDSAGESCCLVVMRTLYNILIWLRGNEKCISNK